MRRLKMEKLTPGTNDEYLKEAQQDLLSLKPSHTPNEISIINELRRYSGIGMMECEKCLRDNNWDYQLAKQSIHKYHKTRTINHRDEKE